MSKRSQQLTKEQIRALNIYEFNKDKFKQLLNSNPNNIYKSNSLLTTNFIAASRSAFVKSKLPRESTWSWNQSNSKATVNIGGELLSLRKISPRNRVSGSNEKLPPFKIWLYHEVSDDTHYLWCEKGEELGVETEIGRIYPNEVSLSMLSFLSSFVDTETAKELGW